MNTIGERGAIAFDDTVFVNDVRRFLGALDGATLGQLRSMFDVLEGLAGWKDEGSPSLRATFGVA